MKYLFPNFLTNEQEYNICKNYWETKIEYLFTKNNLHKWESYIGTTWANGREQLSGNPIVNYYIPSINKAFRIIQEEPETETVILGVWTSKFKTDTLNTTELVVSLEFTPETEQMVFDLIEKWIIDDYSVLLMDKYIDFVYESTKQKSNNLHEEIKA